MKTILKLTEHLLIDLSTGECFDQEGYSNSQFREHLTSGQLKLLNYFVENRELLCSFSQLEGLFDDELGDYKMPGIKQQIWRIKQKLNNIDINFDSDKSKQIFQSVSGRGYIFHMPIHGRIYQRNSPSDYLWHITPEFCANLFLYNIEDKEKLQHQFFSGEADCKVTMRAICNEIHFMNVEYINILQSVMLQVPKSDAIAPILLMGDKGSGVSTLTCALGKYLSEAKPNWNIYYCDLSRIHLKGKQTLNEIFMYLNENHIGKVRKNVVLFDNPQDNAEIFEFIYSFFVQNKFEHIHFVITGYKASLLSFLKDSSSLTNSILPYAYYIGSYEGKTVLSSPIQFQMFKHYDFPMEVKVQAVNGMVENYLICKPIEKEIVIKILSELVYKDKNIKELFLEFVYQYNSILFERGITQKYIYIPNIEMEWREWEEKCQTLDVNCDKLLLSELFPYIAILNILDIPVTFELIRKMTGYSYQNRLLHLFYKKYSNIWFENGKFTFHNKSIPFIFFSMFPEYKPMFFIQELITHDYMDSSTLLLFIKHVIWYPLKFHKDILWNQYAEKLMEMLQQNATYQKICNNYIKEEKRKVLADVWEQEPMPAIDYMYTLNFFNYCQSQ